MCGRFVLEISLEQLMKVYRLSSIPNLSPRYNIAPRQHVAVVREQYGGDRELTLMQWGLVPSWSKDRTIGYKMINARSETAHEKPSFKQAFHARRCVIPASGFYEWEKSGGEKIPHYIHFRDGTVMSLAGLWEQWTSPDGETLPTCTILTTTANSLIKTLHDRMPVILHRDEIDCWLDRHSDDIKRLTSLFHPYPPDQLEQYAVTRQVNNPINDFPGCVTPVKQD
ncbi:MAG: SOS response-associated peptidase [Deltaproteobacteria bacterium]|jgi:putative SOS response-associated peptidase YedK|nr:SOS response-associated peptidase [Deltaproteobacteria bacterium]